MNDIGLPSNLLRFLDDYQVQARKIGRMIGAGAHKTPRSGQSLEFKEHSIFTLGDDIRFIDRIASHRAQARGRKTGLPWEHWVVRRFQAEEHFRTVISIDNSQTMRYPREEARRSAPGTITKLQMARWIAEGIAHICLNMGDRVTVHPLFGNSAPRPMAKGALARQISLAVPDTDSNELNLEPLHDLLPPSAIWLIVTDLYTPSEALVEKLHSAKAGRRQIVLIELDSWPYERRLLGLGLRRVDGPISQTKNIYITRDEQNHVEAELIKKREKFQQFAISRWAWPETFDTEDSVNKFFMTQFSGDQAKSALASIFIRD